MSVDEKYGASPILLVSGCDDDVPGLAIELSAILGFVEQLSELDRMG